MSILHPKIYVYWGPRREDARACAARLVRMFEDLHAIHPAFARWYHQGCRPAEWSKPFCSWPPKRDELTAVFEKGKHYKDVPREPMPELGYSVATWNGYEEDCGLVLSINAGSWSEFTNFPNNVCLDLRRRTAVNADLETTQILSAALRVIVTAWDADWGRVYDWDYKNPIANPPQGQRPPPFRSGWMVYLASRFADCIVPPPQAIIEKVPHHGLMIYATREILDLDNPAHMAAAAAIQAALAPIQGMVQSKN